MFNFEKLISIAYFAEETVQNYVSCIISFIEYCKDNLKIEPAKCQGHHILGWITVKGSNLLLALA
jgi:hypothetical protein